MGLFGSSKPTPKKAPAKKVPASVQHHNGDRHPGGGHWPRVGDRLAANDKVWDGYGWQDANDR
jgi:hypothetical protein